MLWKQCVRLPIGIEDEAAWAKIGVSLGFTALGVAGLATGGAAGGALAAIGIAGNLMRGCATAATFCG